MLTLSANRSLHMIITSSPIASLHVCMYVYSSHISKTTCMLPVAVVINFVWWHCNKICTSGFVDDAMFSRALVRDGRHECGVGLRSTNHQEAEQGMGRWVMGHMGHENRMGHIGH